MGDSRFASRQDVYGECPRSGKRVLLHEMVPDGYVVGLMVHEDYYDPPHPQESLPPLVEDPINVQNPSPDLTRSTVVVTFPTYNILADRTYGGMEVSISLGKPTVSVVDDPLDLLITDTGGWFTDENGNVIGVSI